MKNESTSKVPPLKSLFYWQPKTRRELLVSMITGLVLSIVFFSLAVVFFKASAR